ncbi:MAG: oxygen-dependent coproporphyrinogen oxidase [Planctomycetota bacterium]
MQAPVPHLVRSTLESFQEAVCSTLEGLEPEARFRGVELARPGGGMSRPKVLEGGRVIERAAVNFTHTHGAKLPPAATERRPELAGAVYEAISVSLIVHPRNPFAPTTHANFRFFRADEAWWFGGGFDLTPYYGFDEDCVHWHRTARAACEPFGGDVHTRFKRWCDEYFFLEHRDEPRGIGGVFFDDLDEPAHAEALWRALIDAFLPAYLPILARRHRTPYGERERDWQLIRRGRYVEFNLLFDRGTLFGLQAGGRVESILGSLPPEVRWRYDHQPEPGSPEERLHTRYLVPADWAAGAPE